MSPRKVNEKMKNARECKLQKNISKSNSIFLNALRFTFSVIISGCSYITTQLIFLWNNIVPPSETYFY